jgi:hypothetical protein
MSSPEPERSLTWLKETEPMTRHRAGGILIHRSIARPGLTLWIGSLPFEDTAPAEIPSVTSEHPHDPTAAHFTLLSRNRSCRCQ